MKLKLFTLLSFLTITQSVQAEKKFNLDVSFGTANIAIDNRAIPQSLDLIESNEHTFGYSIHLGYQLKPKLIAELGFDLGIDSLFGASDSVSVFNRNLGIGYKFEPNDGMYFLPQIGLSSWTIKFTEGQFLNPGPEAQFRHDGSDLFLKTTVGWHLSQRFDLYLSYKYLDTDIADFSGANFGFKFFF